MTLIALLYIVTAALAFAGLLAMLAMWRTTHRATVCPETGASVLVEVDRKQAAKAVFTGAHLKVINCERWAERELCDRDCEHHLHA